MTRLRLASLWVLFLAVLGAFLAALPPGLEASSTSADIGEARCGETVVHTFRVRKTGMLDFRVREVASSCSCLKSSVTVAGDSVEIRLVMTMPNHSRTVAGEVVLTTNGFWRDRYVFRIEGTCRAPMEIRPVDVDFGFFPARRPTPLTHVSLIEYDPRSCGTLGLRVDDPAGLGGVTASLAGDPSDARRLLSVRVDPEVPVGPLTASLVFSFGRGTIEPVQIKCLGVAQGGPSVNPPEAFFGRISPDRPASLTLQVDPPTRLRLIDVRSDPDRRISASVETAGDRDSLKVTVTAPGLGAKPGAQVAVIRLRCADTSGTQIQIPVVYQHQDPTLAVAR